MVHLLLAILSFHTGSMQHSNICLQFPVTGTCILNTDPAGNRTRVPLGHERDTPFHGMNVQGYCSDRGTHAPQTHSDHADRALASTVAEEQWSDVYP